MLALVLPDLYIDMKDFTYIHDVIERIYKDGFSSQALTDRLEGATEVEQKQIVNELNRDKSLVSPYQFTEDAAAFRRIEFGPNVKSAVKHSSQNTAIRDASIAFDITPQPLFHKNFDLLTQAFEDYILKGYKLYILADSEKQTQRLKDIFADMDSPQANSIVFEPINKTIHAITVSGYSPAISICFSASRPITV